jgi:selenocysteine-specific translation elongation factor
MTISARILSCIGLIALSLMTPGCGDSSFKFRVDDVFYITTIDRVIVTGTVSSGSAKAGDKLIVRIGSTDIPVTVERFEHPTRKVESAATGDQVGLVLVGIRKDQVRSGDFVLRL